MKIILVTKDITLFFIIIYFGNCQFINTKCGILSMKFSDK